MSIPLAFSSKSVSSLIQIQIAQFNFRSDIIRRHVHLHGNVSLQVGNPKKRRKHGKISPSNSSTHSFGEKPPDPEMLTSSEYLEENVDKVSSVQTDSIYSFTIFLILSHPILSANKSQIACAVSEMVPGQEKHFMHYRSWNINR